MRAKHVKAPLLICQCGRDDALNRAEVGRDVVVPGWRDEKPAQGACQRVHRVTEKPLHRRQGAGRGDRDGVPHRLGRPLPPLGGTIERGEAPGAHRARGVVVVAAVRALPAVGTAAGKVRRLRAVACRPARVRAMVGVEVVEAPTARHLVAHGKDLLHAGRANRLPDLERTPTGGRNERIGQRRLDRVLVHRLHVQALRPEPAAQALQLRGVATGQLLQLAAVLLARLADDADRPVDRGQVDRHAAPVDPLVRAPDLQLERLKIRDAPGRLELRLDVPQVVRLQALGVFVRWVVKVRHDPQPAVPFRRVPRHRELLEQPIPLGIFFARQIQHVADVAEGARQGERAGLRHRVIGLLLGERRPAVAPDAHLVPDPPLERHVPALDLAAARHEVQQGLRRRHPGVPEVAAGAVLQVVGHAQNFRARVLRVDGRPHDRKPLLARRGTGWAFPLLAVGVPDEPGLRVRLEVEVWAHGREAEAGAARHPGAQGWRRYDHFGREKGARRRLGLLRAEKDQATIMPCWISSSSDQPAAIIAS